MVAMLHLHPSEEHRLRSGNVLSIERIGIDGESGGRVSATEYEDSFGNRCTRFVAPGGHLRLGGWNIVEELKKKLPSDISEGAGPIALDSAAVGAALKEAEALLLARLSVAEPL